MAINYVCDLHGHTNRSDGNDSPKEFIDHAAELGMKIVAITDHDVIPPVTIEVDGKTVDTVEYAASKGVTLLLGIEISCETFIDDVHLVCFGCDWSGAYFESLEMMVIESKIGGYRKLVEELNAHGMPMTWEEVLENGGNPVTEEFVQKKMIFELMARKGYCESWKDAKLFVKENKDIVVKRIKPAALSVINEMHRIGGTVIMAHPYLVTEPINFHGAEITRKQYIEILMEAGLDGIEASYTYDKTSYSGTMTKDEIEKEIKDLYKDKLIISGGSDYHNDGKKGVANPRDIGDSGITLEDFMSQKGLVALLP